MITSLIGCGQTDSGDLEGNIGGSCVHVVSLQQTPDSELVPETMTAQLERLETMPAHGSVQTTGKRERTGHVHQRQVRLVECR